MDLKAEMKLLIFNLSVFFIVFYMAISLVSMGGKNLDLEIDSNIESNIDIALKNYQRDLPDDSGNRRSKSILTGLELTESKINLYIDNNNLRKDLMKFWNRGNESYICSSALGTDGKHHILNSFLKGFEPFETEQPFIPLYTIAMRKKYKYDHLQYNGKKDVWQDSYESFKNIYGDCEDHSILLADWLIQMGYDARVIVGKYKDSGHAWVVVFEDEKVYLLEATSKRKESDFHKMPYAYLMKNYHPKFMFNHRFFWLNTGSTLTTDYKNSKWQKKSIYYSM